MNCEYCGQPLTTGDAACPHCGQSISATPAPPARKPENVLTGILGAVVGALIGAAAIILLSQIGWISAISGFVLAFCTLKGYELLGHRLSTKGIIICVVLMVLTPYFADRLDWAIAFMTQLPEEHLTFREAYGLLPLLLRDGILEKGSYLSNLGLLYLFTALGGVSAVIGQFKKRK